MTSNRGPKRELDGQSAMPRFSSYRIPPREGTVPCALCAKWVKAAGLADHMRDVHPQAVLDI